MAVAMKEWNFIIFSEGNLSHRGKKLKLVFLKKKGQTTLFPGTQHICSEKESF